MKRHDAEAERRFPGPDYRQVLRWLHEHLRPRVYVEIGVLRGDTMLLANPDTVAVGVDPAADVQAPLPRNARLFRMTSDDFFQREELDAICASDSLGLAFVDGLHLFEQVIRDVHGLMDYAGPETIVALHDTVPLNAETSTRVRRTEFHTGDVWKAVVYLRAHWPELRVLTIPAAPTGITLLRGFGARQTATPDGALLSRIAALDWPYFEQHHTRFLNLGLNEQAALHSFCQ